ncbi:MAG: YlmC/YmxH family sporulation protein [Desulfotomaculaceae bacterium]|nr:YlmC/YmxH family sporulation protein [Desulfotomaculaceae bacterium]
MRMSELVGKEIINIYNGARLGVVGDSDMEIDVESGEIRSIILPKKSNIINLWLDRQHLMIPWEAVKKIGAEVIIVDLDQTSPGFQRYLF